MKLHTAFALSLWQRQHRIKHRTLSALVERVDEGLRNDPKLMSEAIFEHANHLGIKLPPGPLPEIPLAWRRIHDFQIAYIDDPQYPALLKEIADPPVLIYYRGQGSNLADDQQVTIVGSRKCSQYGRMVLEDLIPELCLQGWRTVSGFALGIDGICHRLTLDHGGETLAVLPCSLDKTYPPSHLNLRRDVEQAGFMISEYPPDTDVRKHHFVARNRLLSGLSDVTVIVEAWEKSGTLLTANAAADQGRTIMAVPGSIYAPGSMGCNRLIEEGAMVYLSSRSLLEFTRPYNRVEENSGGETSGAGKSMGGDEAVLRVLLSGPKTLQDLRRALPQFDEAKLNRSLVLAELRLEVTREMGAWALTRQGKLRL